MKVQNTLNKPNSIIAYPQKVTLEGPPSLSVIKRPFSEKKSYTPWEKEDVLSRKIANVEERTSYLNELSEKVRTLESKISEYNQKTQNLTSFSGIDKVLRNKYNREYDIENLIKEYQDVYKNYDRAYESYEKAFAQYEPLVEEYKSNLLSARSPAAINAQISSIKQRYEDDKKALDDSQEIQNLITLKEAYKDAEEKAQREFRPQDIFKYNQLQKEIDKQIESLYSPLKKKKDENLALLESELGAYYTGLQYRDDFEEKAKYNEKIITPIGVGDVAYEISKLKEYMTDEEKSIYNYLINSNASSEGVVSPQGMQAANNYIDYLWDTLERRKAGEKIEKTEALPNGIKQISKTIQAFGSGVQGWGQGTLNELFALADKAGIVEHSGEIQPTATQYAVGQYKENSNGFGRFVYNLAETTGNMAPSILLSRFTGNVLGGATSAAKATKIAKAVGGVSMGMSAAGNAYSEKIKEGWSEDKALKFSALVGVSEIALDRVLGGITALGGGNITAKTAAKIASAEKALTRIAGNLAVKGANEALEEGLQTVLEPLFAALLGEKYTPAQLEEIVYAAGLGFASVGLLETVDTALADSRVPLGEDVINEFIKQGKNAPANSLEYAVAKEITNIFAINPEATITAFEMGRIVRYYKQKGAVSSKPSPSINQSLTEKSVENVKGTTKNTPTDNVEGGQSNIVVKSGKSALDRIDDGKETAAYVLASNVNNLKDMSPATHVTGKEFNNREKRLSDQIREFFKKIGGKVTRAGFGEVEFGEYGIGGMLNHKPLNRAKVVGLAAAPDVIKNGKQIYHNPNWKGRGYESYIFAAPVSIGENTVYVAAVVNRNPNNKFYLSEMVDSNGNYVRIEESPTDNAKSGVTDGVGKTNKAGITAMPEGLTESESSSIIKTEPISDSTHTIPQTSPEVKSEEVNMPTVSRDGIEIKNESDPEVQKKLAEAKDDLERTGILSGASEKTIALARRLEKALGVKIRFEVSPVGTQKNGRYNRIDDTIYVNMAENNHPVIQVIVHEFVHAIEKTRLHSMLRRFAQKEIDRSFGKGAFNNNAHEQMKIYEEKGKKLTLYQAENEVICNFISEKLLKSEETITRFVNEHKEPAQKLKNIIDGVLSVFGKGDTKDDARTRLALQKASKLYRDAMNTRKTGVDLKGRIDDLRQKARDGEISDAEYETALERLAAEADALDLNVEDFFKGGGDSYSFSTSKSGMANDLLLPYNEEMTRLIKQRGDYIINSYNNLVDVVNLAFDNPELKATAYFGIIDSDTLGEIKSNIPNLPNEFKDTLFKENKTYSIAATLDSIRHIVDDKKLSRNDVIEYLDKLADTIVEHDTVTFDYYVDNNGQRNRGLLFKKRFDDGTLRSFEVVSNKKRSLNLQTLYLEKGDYKKRKNAETLLMDNPSAHTPKAGVGQTSINSISKTSQNVNSKDLHSISTPVFTPKKAADEATYNKLDTLKKARNKMLFARGKASLTARDEDAVTALLNGEMTLDELDDSYNKKDIEAVYEASLDYEMEKVEAEEMGIDVASFTKKGGGDSFSITRIKGDSGKDYGIGVYLDSSLLTNLSESERIEMVKEYVKELGGNTFTAYDTEGNSINIRLAEHSQKFKNKNGNTVRVNKDLTSYLNNKTKQEAIVLVDELITNAKYDSSSSPKYSHDWLDNYGKNDWEYWKVYLQEKNKTVWEATLNIANTANGEKILYDIYPIKMVEQVVTSTTSTTTDSISQNSKNVNTNSYSISTPVFTPEKAADEVVKRAENSADVTERLPIKAHNKLREVEKKLCRDIANHYGVYGYRVNELQEGVRRLTSEYLESGSVSLETIKEFADFMKERFGKEDSFTGEDGITYPLSNGVKFAIREAINSDLKYIKAEYQRISDEVNGKREESASEDMATARNERTRRFVSKKVRELRNTLTEDFGVAEKDKKGLEERIYALVAKISLGTFTEADVSSFYGDVFDSVSILDDTMKQNYPLVYSYLKTTKLTLSESNKKDLAGYGSYKEFREDAPSFLKIGKEGTSVADMYSELNDLAPDLFPKDVINENDEAVKILEVAKRFVSSRVGLRETMSPEERKSLYDRTERAVKGLERDVRTAIRYSQGTATVTEQAYVEDNDVDVAEVTEKLEALKRERSKMLLARGKTILSDKDERALRAIIDGTQTIEGLDDSYNKKDIEMVYEASREYEKLKAEAEEYKRALRQRRYDRAKKYLEDGDVLTGFRDHSSAFLYMINPLERNLEYIGKRGEISQRLIDAYVKPIKRANRDGILYKNSIIAKIKALNLSRKSEGGNTHSESFAVQFVGEAESCIETLKRMNNPRATESGKSLAEWQAELEEFWKVNADMDKGKIYGAVEVFRGIYDELFRRMNEARVKSGYEPVSYRKGYFPHFNPRENNDFIALFGKSLGFNMEFDGLPATINGLTHTFKPGIKYFGAAEARQGYETVFDAVEGMQRYLDGVIDVIFQTDNIQNLRALAHEIRYQASDEGLQSQENSLRARNDVTERQRAALIDELHEKGRYKLSNFVTDLEEYTNLLAGKKSKFDRGMESFFGRDMYSLVKSFNGKIAANMISWNVGSWLTNFIPLIQGTTGLKTKYMLQGMTEALVSVAHNDGFEAQSTFLATRRGSDELLHSWQMNSYKTKAGKAVGSALDASSEAGMKAMEWIDMYVANSLVRGRYKQNVAKGLDSEAALEEADSWAGGLMADRSKGGLPTVFSATNPVFKAFTQFQVEVMNQVGFFYRDVPKDLRDKGILMWCLAIFKYLLAAYLFDELYEKLTGRRPAFDPLGIINDTVGNASGVQLNNAVDVVFTLAKGEGFDLTKEVHKMSAWNVVTDFTGEIVEEVPFVGGLFGGGRIPMSSALPDIEAIGQTLFSDANATKKWTTLGEEIAKPLAYAVLPGGGGQITKGIKGIKAVKEGGKYTVDSKGREKLQYPVTPNFATYLQAGLFGATATSGGQDWVKSGFSTGLSWKETSAYKAMVEEGATQDEAFDILDALGEIKEKDGDLSLTATKAKALADSDLSDDVKRTAYEYLYMKDSHKEYVYLADEFGIGKEVFVDFLIENHDAKSKEDLVEAFGDRLLKNGKVSRRGKELDNKTKAVLYQIITNNKTNPYNSSLGKRIWKLMNPDEKY